MADAVDILAIDVATRCGWCRGRVGTRVVPTTGSIKFSGSTNNAVFGNGLAWISDLLKPEPRPNILILEAMLPIDAMVGKTQRATRDRLAGLHGIMRGVAHLRGIGEIAEAQVGDVRQHFIGARGMKSDAAKRAVMERCWLLGWKVDDDNAGDAAALWHYAASLVKPELALEVSPLFRARIAAP